jgi:hypothetical protein
MGIKEIKHEELRDNFSKISNEVFELIGTDINSITKIENYEEKDCLIICLPPMYEFEYSKSRRKDFQSDLKTLEKHFGITLS